MFNKANQLTGFYVMATLAFNELSLCKGSLLFRSSHLRCSQDSTCVGISFLIKLQAAYSFIKKKTKKKRHRCFFENFAKYLRTSFLQKCSGQLLSFTTFLRNKLALTSQEFLYKILNNKSEAAFSTQLFILFNKIL